MTRFMSHPFWDQHRSKMSRDLSRHCRRSPLRRQLELYGSTRSMAYGIASRALYLIIMVI